MTDTPTDEISKDRTDTAGGGTILVVEDEILIRLVIADYLRGCGYKVYEASSGDEAMILLQQGELKIDLVFTDTEMPGRIDGFALARWLRANRPEVEVILVGSPAKATDTASDLCDDGPLPKPYHPQVVIDRIRRLLASRSRR
ncbi:response regulator transcription factor [Ferrovibrio xuzhouensis]|uniref:Response regulator transcription factor n=1 Tax=Ferrovibrio xuzhouensis TaxID=1576914 RepID=A0ABV7VE61_9PROT